MRERLIELLVSAPRKDVIFAGTKVGTAVDFPYMADYLLANGVIVPPCKVGTVVYVVRSKTSNGKNLYMREERIDHYRVFDERIFMCFERGEMSVADYMWKESIFLTKEEAEKALRGGEE